jgi:hypothetical protein
LGEPIVSRCDAPEIFRSVLVEAGCFLLLPSDTTGLALRSPGRQGRCQWIADPARVRSGFTEQSRQTASYGSQASSSPHERATPRLSLSFYALATAACLADIRPSRWWLLAACRGHSARCAFRWSWGADVLEDARMGRPLHLTALRTQDRSLRVRGSTYCSTGACSVGILPKVPKTLCVVRNPALAFAALGGLAFCAGGTPEIGLRRVFELGRELSSTFVPNTRDAF